MKHLVCLAAFSVVVALPTFGQMTIGPWTTTAVGAGCVPPLSCVTCATGSVAGVGGGTVTATLQSMSATPSNIFAVSTCSTGIKLTSTMTIGLGGGGSRIIVASDLTGSLNTLSLGSTGCAASVKINGGATLDLQHPTVVNPAGLVSVGDHREDICLLLAPGVYTVDIVLETISTTPFAPPPVVVDTADFMSPGNGLVVSFSDDGPANAIQATTIQVNGCPPNPDILTADPAIIGKPWSASVTLGFNRAAAIWTLFFGFSSISPPCGVVIPQFLGAGGVNFGNAPAGRVLLCSINTSGPSLTAVHTGVLATVSTANASLPCDVSLIGIHWCGQAIVVGAIAPISGGGNLRLSSGIEGVIGSF